MLNAGEVAEVDLIRARLQVASRRDELEQAKAAETATAGSLRVLVGYDFATPIEVVDLATALPDGTEIDRFVFDFNYRASRICPARSRAAGRRAGGQSCAG
jgi:hypothetical protein